MIYGPNDDGTYRRVRDVATADPASKSRASPSRDQRGAILKMKKPEAAAVKREAEEDWG
jgi:hypothetical protein